MLKRLFFHILVLILFVPNISYAQNIAKLQDTLNVLDSSLKRVEKVVTTANKIAMGKKYDAMSRFLNGIYLLKHKRPQDAAALFLSLINHPQLGKEATFYLSEAMYMNRNYLVAAEYYRRVILQKWNPVFRSKAIKRILEISMRTHSFKGIEEVILIVEKNPNIKNDPAVLYARGKYSYYQGDEILKNSKGISDEERAISKFNEALKFFELIKPNLKKGKYVFPDLYAQAIYYSGATLVRLALAGALSYFKDGKLEKLEKWTSSPALMREILLLEAVRKFSYLAATSDLVKTMKKYIKTKNSGNYASSMIFVPRNQNERDIQTLSRMAMGRIFYELGETREAIKWYNFVDKKSKYYEDALYEIAWVYVRENSIVKATEILALMEARNKNSIFLPRAKLLLGYLKVKGGKWIEASRSFNNTSIKYKKVYQNVIKLKDTKINIQQFFDQVIRSDKTKKNIKQTSNSSMLSINYNIPDEAIPMFLSDRILMKSILVTGDVRTIKAGIKEARQSLQIIKRRLHSAGKIGIFPLLKDIRTKTYSYEFKNMDVRKKILGLVSQKFTRYLNQNLKNRLKLLQTKRLKLEQKIATMPKSTDSIKLRVLMQRKAYDKKIMQVDNLKKDLLNYQRFLKALYKYYTKLPAKKKNKLKYLIAKFREESANLNSVIEMADNIKSKIVDASLEIGVAGDGMQEEILVRKEYGQLIKEEFSIFDAVKTSFASDDAALFDKLYNLMLFSDKVNSRMNLVNTKLLQLADAKLLKIKTVVATEDVNIQQYEKLYKVYDQRNMVLSKNIAKDSLNSIASKFYDIVIESDLGLVDVSWSKRAKSRENWVKVNFKNTKLTKELRQRFGEVDNFDIKINKDKFSDPFIIKKSVKKNKLKQNSSKKKSNGGKSK